MLYIARTAKHGQTKPIMHQSSINHPLIIRDVERFNFEQCNTTWNNNFQMNIGSWPEFQAPAAMAQEPNPQAPNGHK
jgi:hypothetical protein